VVELRVPLQGLQGRDASVVVAGRIELQPVPGPDRAIALRPQLGARTGDCEIHVEDDGAQRGAHDVKAPAAEAPDAS